MTKKNKILSSIREIIKNFDPKTKVYLFGSFARNEQKRNSDLDLLILVDKKNITYSDEKRFTSSLYDLEFETGQIISPIVLSKTQWETVHKITPFYEDIKREGIEL